MFSSYTNGFGMSQNNTNNNDKLRLGDRAQLIGDDKNLKSDMQDLTREDLRERLFVAEKVMKTLF
jgi:hypothetical protein